MDKRLNSIAVTAAAIGVLLIGCSKFLDKQPQGIETRESFYTNSNQALRATTAVYDATAWYTSQEVSEWVFGDICSDDAEKGGENPADFATRQQYKIFQGVNTDGDLTGRWSENYQGVYRANLVIENVPNIAMDEDLRNRLVAEAKFLRAYFYFQLVKTFGPVPLILKELERGDYCHPKATMQECWAHIEKDLKEAAEVLPEKSAYPLNEMGRATKGAANSLLAKAYIFQSKWSDAQERAFAVIKSGEYQLEPNYADIFKLSHENGMESIFEIQHITIATNDWGDGNEGTVTTIYTSSRRTVTGYFKGWGFNCPTEDFVKEFEPNDPRLKATVIFDGDTVWEGTPEEQRADNFISPTKMHARKYTLEYVDPAPAMSNAPNNWQAIRFADVLLFHAEAANENGETATALESLNRVRARVGLPTVTTTDKDSLRKAIYHERRVELGLEGHRFFDLVRQGRAEEVLGKNGFVKGKHEYFPIPQQELDACDKLEQNNYY